jgi:predicted ArsR family transcriptional regulator
MASQPGNSHTGRDLAARLGITPRQMRIHLADWARKGFITRTSPGRYALPAPATTDAGP